MPDFTQREYYKIFTGTNQTDGHEKIHLGYEGNTSEITFKKDNTTYFHIPFFAQSQLLTDSALIADGAIPGPVPAMADRIFKKQAGYGKNTPWGNTSQVQDGTWLCSWLYATPGDIPQWLDRYFDPGRLPIEEALAANINIGFYVANNPVYYDVPSEMTLEPACWYQYFHQGEKTNHDIVQTYSGLSGNRIRLNIDDWSASTLDKSNYSNQVNINNFQSSWVASVYDPGYIDRNALSFDNNSFINCSVSYNSSYNLLNEFTLSFWFYNDSWNQATATQLVGNLRQGGYGVYYDNLKYYPYFIIPETTYGHLFLFNQECNSYYDKNIQSSTQQTTKPIFTGINSESEIIVVDEISQRVYKYNYIGDILAVSKNTVSETDFLTLVGTPKTAIIGGDNSTTVITTSGTYVLDKDLILSQFFPSLPYNNSETLAYNFSGNLIREPNSIDIKYDFYNNKWGISTSGKLYCNNEIIHTFPGLSATNIAIDPENNLWVLADFNDIYKYNTQTKQIITQFKIGIDGIESPVPDTKNISFIYSYDRVNDTKTWYALIVHSQEQNLYQTTLYGDIKTVTHLPERLNIQYPITSTQDPNSLTFTCKGDFTGYEWKRVFHKVLYNNTPQIQFKVAAKRPTRGFVPTRFTLSTPVNFLIDKTWYLVTCTLKNNETKIYINNKLQNTSSIPGNYDLIYAYKNDLYIGCPTGKSDNLNTEINSQALIWNGFIDTIRIYDYAVDTNTIQALLREKVLAQDIIWNIPTAPLQYIETIEHFFKHKLPGHKSPFFNIKLSGLKITDSKIRKQIENEVKLAVSQIKPAYTQLLNVEWID